MKKSSASPRSVPSAHGRVCASALLVATALGGAPRAARAQQDASAADLSAARGLFFEGMKLADAGRCAEAVDRFERAARLHQAVTIFGRLGECQVELGKVVLGAENLLRAVRERLPANAPPAFVAAQARAQRALDAAVPKIAKLKLSLKAPPAARPAITIDGEPLSTALLDTQRPTDPGPHVVEVSAPGFLKESARVALAEGDAQTLTITLRPDPNAATAASPAKAPGAGPPGAVVPAPGARPPADGAGPNRLPLYLALGAGAAGLAVGVGFGAASLAKYSGLTDRCQVRSECPPEAQRDIDSLSRFATVSTVGFGVAAAGLGTALVLWLAADSPAPKAERQARVRPWVGVGGAGLGGTF